MNWALILPIHPPSHSPDVHTVFELDIRDRVGKRRVPQLWVVVPRRDFERIDNMSGHIWAKPFPEPSQVGPDPLTDWGGDQSPAVKGGGVQQIFFLSVLLRASNTRHPFCTEVLAALLPHRRYDWHLERTQLQGTIDHLQARPTVVADAHHTVTQSAGPPMWATGKRRRVHGSS